VKLYSDIPFIWLLPAFLFGFGIAYFYYRKQKEIHGDNGVWKKWLLVSLRGSALFLLFTLLIGILMERKTSRSEKPLFITLFDNSASLLNYRDSNVLRTQLVDYQKELQTRFEGKYELLNLYVDQELTDDSLDLSGQLTDLNVGFQGIFDRFYNQNIGGVCLISDGNFNAGSDPQYTVEKLSLVPVFTLGVGDSIPKKDQLIRNTAANEIAFLGNEFPVEVSFEGQRLKGKQAKLTLFRGEDKVAEETVVYDDVFSFKTLNFNLKADRPGFNRYTVKLEEITGETTLANNVVSFYVEVIDTKSKVLILTDAPHPDITAIRQVLKRNEKLETEVSFYNEWDNHLEDVELVIFYGLQSERALSANDLVKKKGIGSWYFYTLNSNASYASRIIPSVDWPRSSQKDDVGAYVANEFQLFEVTSDIEKMVRTAPPLQVKFGDIKGNPGIIFLRQRIGNVEKKDPVMAFQKDGKRKTAFTAGEGIWRWKLSEFARTGEQIGFNALIEQSVQYLILRNNNEPLRVELPKRFNSNDDVIIDASFYNASLEAITEPEIDFKLEDEQGQQFDYRFAKRSKDYQLNLGKLKPGAYSWNASTSHDDRKYTKTGMFVVENISLESMSTNADFGLLRKLSSISNGAFFELKDKDDLFNLLDQRKDIVTINYEESDFIDLIDLIWILLLVALLLSAEWFIRRYSGSY
jgi:hypothetical protein